MIDIKTEQLLSITLAAAWLGSRIGTAPSRTTVYRWVTAGIKGKKLESTHIGGMLFTSVEALERFSAALSGDPAPVKHQAKRGVSAAQEKVRLLLGG
jgi:hypothetical protein